ncbi:ORF6C domain-containing protein [Cytobacillus kochii]|uniref:ORF6C domain-containing protein n=1 Tax=Cytobacillus kochii TaxID=859143 RepID=UPI002E1AE9AF|nr:ORF6C domain-containing protein [Cytobacillus kochii]
MNELQTFKNKLFEVAAKIENGQILFDAEQVAKSLGFVSKTIKNGFTYENVRWSRVNSFLPQVAEVKKGDLIPEPLVYKLAFKAQNEVAEKFQDWLAIEVIPQIRKTGSYSNKVVPLNNKESLIAAMKLSIETSEELDQVKGEVKEIRHMVEEQITLTSGEQRRLQKGIAMKVYEIENDPEYRPSLFREIHREIKDRFGVASYKDIKRKELQAALNYIEHWVPRKVS